MSDQFPPAGDPAGEPTPPSGATPPPPPPPPPAPPGPPPPPPPPPATPGPPPPPPSVPGSTVDVGEAFSWAMAKFQQHIGIWVGLAAVVFALRAIQQLLANIIANATANNCTTGTVVGSGGVNSVTACETGIFAGVGISIVLGIVFGALAALASIGVYRAALKRSQGATPEFSMLTTGENLGPFIVVAIVYGILSAVGLVLCILPGLAVIFLFQFAPLFALDKGQGVGEAFGNSYRVVMKNLGPVILAALVNIVAAMLGGLIFGILTLVTLPFAALFTVHVYRQLNGEPVAAT